MSQAYTALQFHQSFERCVNDPNFLDQFYQIFLSSSDEVEQIFKETNMETQKIILATSMAYMTETYDSKSSPLENIAIKHNKNNLNICPHLYPLWLNSLIAAAKTIDPFFDSSTEKVWRETLQPGIDYMISQYNGSD